MAAKYFVFLLQLALIIGTFECYYSSTIVNICENENLHLSCQSNERIEIIDSFYGRKEGYVCGQTYQPHVCTKNTTNFLREQCNGLKECSLQVTNENLHVEDPCYNIPKYLQVKAQCLIGGHGHRPDYGRSGKTVYVCESDNQVIACPDYSTISVHSALYGRDNERDGPVCNKGRDNYSYCPNKDVTIFYKNLCSDQEQCTLHADYTKLGDPCPGVFKYLKLKYSCEHSYYG